MGIFSRLWGHRWGHAVRVNGHVWYMNGYVWYMHTVRRRLEG
jgi:hypothetical protein